MSEKAIRWLRVWHVVCWCGLVLGLMALAGCGLAATVEVSTLMPTGLPTSEATTAPATVEATAAPLAEGYPGPEMATLEGYPGPETEATGEQAAETETATQQPTSSASATPTPVCDLYADSRLQAAWEAAGLGCATAEAQEEQWGAEAFEHGVMLWREADRMIYILADDGAYSSVADEWQETMPERSCDLDEPEGLDQPKRGFGLVWCRDGDVRDQLGFATQGEYSTQGLYQSFERGVLFWQYEGPVRVLYSDGTWRDLGPQ